MTKKYDIIHLNGFMYVVDEAKKAERGWNYNYALKQLFNFEYDYPSHSSEWNFCKGIIATNDSLLGLLLLPEIEEDVVLYEGIEEPQYPVRGVAERYYIAGYKAASTKKYTEEDMRNLWHLSTGLYEGSSFEEAFDYLKSLNPLPIAIEVELDTYDKTYGHINPKVDENNFVKVVKWIYE